MVGNPHIIVSTSLGGSSLSSSWRPKTTSKGCGPWDLAHHPMIVVVLVVVVVLSRVPGGRSVGRKRTVGVEGQRAFWIPTRFGITQITGTTLGTAVDRQTHSWVLFREHDACLGCWHRVRDFEEGEEEGVLTPVSTTSLAVLVGPFNGISPYRCRVPCGEGPFDTESARRGVWRLVGSEGSHGF